MATDHLGTASGPFARPASGVDDASRLLLAWPASPCWARATDDLGNWGGPLGVASLLVQGVLVLLAGGGFAALRGRQVETSTERHRVLAA